MTKERWQQVREIFEEAAEHPSQERQTYVQAACGKDAGLFNEVNRLLECDAVTDDFLESPPTLLFDLLVDTSARCLFQPGDLVASRFLIIRLLGHGGMGEVYEAEDTALPKLGVAVKTVRSNMVLNDRVRRRLERELALARQVTHRNVCRMYDIALHPLRTETGDEFDLVVLSMELLGGETLADEIRTCGQLPPTQALAIANQVIEALSAAHSADVVHGDFKPNNVMLVRDRQAQWRAVVTDFGLAHGLASADAEFSGFTIAGVPAYMAPERVLGRKRNAAADVYSLGLVLYELLVGTHPFPSISSFEDAKQAVWRRPPKVKLRSGEFGQGWERVIARCLEPDPARRYQSATDVLAALRRAQLLTRRQFIGMGIGATAAVAALGGYLYDRLVVNAPFASIAVLPFENSSGNPGDDYFVRGITDEVREALTHVAGLRVIAPFSSSEIGKASLSFVSAGSRLSVSHLLAGTVRREPPQVRVTVRLIDASNGLETWKQTIVKPEQNSNSVRLELAASIAPLLRLQFTPASAKTLMQGQTDNAKARDLYLRGRQALQTRSTEDLTNALTLFREGLKEDPQFALAWAASAEALQFLATRAGYPMIDTMTEIQRDALRALELHPELYEALLQMGLVRQRYDWDWVGADDYFKRAVQTNPSVAEGHRLYSGFLSNLSRHEEALREIAIARDLDPLSLPVLNLNGTILYRARRYQESLNVFESVMRMNPDFQNVYTQVGDVYGQLGMWQRAIQLHRTAIARFHNESRFVYNLGFALAMSGEVDEARRIAADLEMRWPKELFPPAYIAQVYRGLHDTDRMFFWLERAWQERDAELVLLKVDPWMDPYRDDNRYQDLIRRMRL